ncbi:MAG TPA: phosphoribosylamine--glycine ligase [Candidatus Desulfofervidus auxilii]|uniref:Multifunctional fusion protein n=1 Tax=Desulfofervidus auxilii TaxID=1621989 RepID=A0A7V0NED1_DESA2|nr:phosphoribosylamine--glycine ligase [Candidatus Desulfofervidus auxilii]
MKVLVIGGGGREHALAWKIAQSHLVKKVFCAPGNGGISKIATCLPIKANDIESLVKFVQKEGIDLTVVGPEEPLVMGIVDEFEKRGLRIFGPKKEAATIEGSKVFAKEFMKKYNIPTADFAIFSDPDEAKAYIKEKGVPIVVKADGLAAGKGAIPAKTLEEALSAVDLIMIKRAFGKAGERVVIEEFLEGEEASFLVLTDGENVVPFPSSQDHKPVFDDDKGPNTGGMGAYSPAPVITPEIETHIMEDIIYPTIKGMANEGTPYKGVLYAGLIIKDKKAKVLEFNCRFGDPEAQPLLMRLKSDLVKALNAVVDGNLKETLEIDPSPAVCVVMASGGYPSSYEKGKLIKGLEVVEKMDDVEVFHAGTVYKENNFYTSGGRVIGVTAKGKNLPAAIAHAYKAVSQIHFEGVHYRKDIGFKALKHLGRFVGIVMGSLSDKDIMFETKRILQKLFIPSEITVASAHRSPERAIFFAKKAIERGMKVIICGAGYANHLAGLIAAHTTLPVIAVPLSSSPLMGFDALISSVQMPAGVPVAVVSLDKAGAKNAAILAAQILALSDSELQDELKRMKKQMAEEVEMAARAL